MGQVECRGCDQVVTERGPWCDLYVGEGRTCQLAELRAPARQVSSSGQVCQDEACEAEAWYLVKAQWSIFDFDEWTVCYEHYGPILDYIALKHVDGFAAVVTVITLELSVNGSTVPTDS